MSLARHVNKLLSDELIHGVVITHGTDTLEETAYFLHLVISHTKPVVLTGSMRPSSAMSADGPMNLFNSIHVACSTNSYNQGVLVVMNEAIFGAREVVKSNTTSLNTFTAPNFGPLGYVRNTNVEFHRQCRRKHTKNSELKIEPNVTKLPKVGIVYAHANHDFLPFKCFIEQKIAGIVIAGMGNGNVANSVLKELKNITDSGIYLVRASRCYSGVTFGGEVDERGHCLIASYDLNPQKARILLQLALLKYKEIDKIRHVFEVY